MNIYHVRQILRTKSIYDIELRVAYYARVSTDKEEQKNSIKSQRRHFEDLISGNPRWKLAGGYIDDGISGIHVEKREQFQAMMADARAGKIDLIVTKEISRFARNTLDSIQYTRELLSYGVCVWFQNDNINTIDDDSEFRLTIMAGVAQDEVRKLSSRVRFGHAQSIKNGVVLGNSHIYGYNKEKGRLTINEQEAPMVRLIFEKYASGEWTTPKIEKLLYDLGYRNYKGGRINRGVIQHIITNPKYKGYYAGGKVKIVDMFTKKQEFIPEEEWNMFKDDGSRVPAIVNEEIWEQANRYFKMRSTAIKERRTSFKDGNLFTGKIFCGNDGAAYWMKQHSVRGKEDPKWVCSHRIKNGANSCSSFGLSELELKTMMAQIIQDYAKNIDSIIGAYISIYERIALNRKDNTSEIDRLKKNAENIKMRMEKILDYNLDGTISDAEFSRRNREYESQLSETERMIQNLSSKPEESDEIRKRLSRMRELLEANKEVKAKDITCSVVNNMISKIMVFPMGSQKAKIQFFLNCGDLSEKIYDKITPGCSDNMIFTI